ncbi:uncharacterized protein LOC115167740 [Salmo trutta]|uniref:uncharacterized protein LOC115167740 n=1 Tax=Salmo trutta TaxID=8032 RepID=UPI001131C279|nr:uncharacterized protein LOC115167740 [Salmo trutta]
MVREGGNIDFKCSIVGLEQHWVEVHVYLCKNGVGIRMTVLEKGEDDTSFTMKDVTNEDSGNYSCVYTRDKLLLDQVKSTDEDLLVIQVYGEEKIFPAKLYGPSNVTQGWTVDLKCITTGIPRNWDKVNVYLCKNGFGIRIAALEKGENDTIFTMKDVTREDSGNYICVYTRDKLIPSQVNSTGDYLVFQVYGDGDVEGKILTMFVSIV